MRPGPAAPGWQLVPRHRLRPPEQGLRESGLILLIQTTHRAVSPEVCLSPGEGKPVSAHLATGEGWAVLGAGTAGRERSWEPEAGASDLRAGLALHFLWKPEFVFLDHQLRMRCSPALFLCRFCKFPVSVTGKIKAAMIPPVVSVAVLYPAKQLPICLKKTDIIFS